MLRRSLHSTRRLYKMASLQPSRERAQEMAENIKAIKDEMAAASSSAPHKKHTTLVLVSKLKPPSDIMAAYEHLSQDERHFGENYVQEVYTDRRRRVSTLS